MTTIKLASHYNKFAARTQQNSTPLAACYLYIVLAILLVID